MGYLPEVVRIIAAHVGGPAGGNAIGTGFFLAVDGALIKEEGLLLTNAHVVTNSPVVKIMTTYIEHQPLPVTVVAVCHDHDLALLKVEPAVHQWLKRSLHERYGLDHIPSLTFGDSNKLKVGYKVHAVGHPLGLIDQQFTTGDYQGPVHLNGEIRGLSGATINGGNSGGALLGTIQNHEGEAVKGLHYYLPSKYEVMGVNTFKLTGANVDGENGFITSNTVRLALPMLLAPLERRHVAEAALQKMVAKMSASGGPANGQVALRALANHLTDKECGVLAQHMSTIESEWCAHQLGGRAGGRPRGFHNWVWRHVMEPSRTHMHSGGPELLSRVLTHAETGDWEGLKAWKAGRRWGDVRAEETAAENPQAMPMVVRMLPPPPAHIHKPHIGMEYHPIYGQAILQHYACPKKEGRYVVGGGVLVTSLTPHSLYRQAGGHEGDIIYAFQNGDTHAELSQAGTWYSEVRDLPLSLTDLCNDTPVGEKVTMFVLRNDKAQRLVRLTFETRQPRYDELPHVRQVYPYCDEGRIESKQKAQVQGIIFAPLRAHHVPMFRLVDYMTPGKQHDFHVVVENVSPESPAYAMQNVHAGSVVTHINDEPVGKSWKEVCGQLSKPHPESGCWAIDTEFQGTRNKFVMVARTVRK